ncbi:MAG: serine/threonine-protein kinase [Byssovorax sp.]
MTSGSPQRASTIAYAPPRTGDDALATSDTQLAPSTARVAFSPPASAARTTVLPRVDSDVDGVTVHLTLEHQGRYEPTKLLGVGGMGEVVLVRDHDIARPVALKRLLPEMNDPAILARFVDEIRTVGRLEHPNIVPIHDVGIDELGRYFFVMKYVEGETLESIIEHLAAGDPAYVAKYSIEVRIELFVGLLHALEYAHAQGIVHRDIKPANIMVGRFGEVVLMDWGIAKPLDAKRDPAAGAEGAITASLPSSEEGVKARMYATRVGSLIGTPAYMSPEQARGDNASLDARSDLYSAMVLFHELIGLRHYLADAADMQTLLSRILSEEITFFKVLGMSYPLAAPPAELVHFIAKGLSKDPAKRFQTAGEVIAGLHAVLEGKVLIQCHITFTKRLFRELGRLVDRRPWVAFAAMLGIVAAVVFSVAQLVRMAIA